MKIRTRITLTENEQAICRLIACQRTAACRREGIVNSKIGPQSDEFIELQGIGAEVAFCKGFNIYPDFVIQTKSALKLGDGWRDAILRGIKIDVKVTQYLTGHLAVAPWKRQDTWCLYALMVGTFPSFTYKGMIASDALIVPDRLKYLGKDKGYLATQSELKEFDDFVWVDTEST